MATSSLATTSHFHHGGRNITPVKAPATHQMPQLQRGHSRLASKSNIRLRALEDRLRATASRPRAFQQQHGALNALFCHGGSQGRFILSRRHGTGSFNYVLSCPPVNHLGFIVDTSLRLRAGARFGAQVCLAQCTLLRVHAALIRPWTL